MNSRLVNCVSIMVVTGLVGVDGAAVYNKCEADHECSRGEYCYQRSGICSSCTNCSVHYRNKLSHRNCPKSPQECGDCLLGYTEDILTEGMKRDGCIRSLTTSTTEATSPESSTSSLIYVLIAALILGCITILLCLGSKYWKKVRGQLSQQNSLENGAVSNSSCNIAPLMSDRVDVHPTVRFMHRNPVIDAAPPPYTSDTSLLIDTGMPTDTSRQTEEIRLNLKQSEEKTTKAVPFIQAYASGESDNEQGNYPVGNENEHIGPNPPDLQDENTMESFWSPPPDYGQLSPHDEVSHVTSETASAALCNDNEDSVSSKVPTPDTSPQHSPNLNRAIVHDDSGISDTSCRTSSTSLPHHPRTSSTSLSHRPVLDRAAVSVHVEQGLPVSQSDEDVSSSAPKRPRRDSGSQSWSDETEGILVCINAQVAVIKK